MIFLAADALLSLPYDGQQALFRRLPVEFAARVAPIFPYYHAFILLHTPETGAAGAVLLATHLGLPVSTTHAIAGAIAGVGSINRLKAVRWGIATNIVGAWVLTIPTAAIIAWVAFWTLHLFGGA